MSRFDDIIEINSELLRMVDTTYPLWNGGARFWLEHRGPTLARRISDSAGLKIWLQAPPDESIEDTLKICSLFADHTIVGHSGPLPPINYGLIFPWHWGDPNWVPEPPELAFKKNPKAKGISRPTFMDRVARPLPPISIECLLGKTRQAIELGLVSYFPASIIYSPVSDDPWPDPAEIFSREGKLPDTRKAGFRAKKINAQGKEEIIDVPLNDLVSNPEIFSKSNEDNKEKKKEDNWPGFDLSPFGYPEYHHPDTPHMWEWNIDAINWEILFASLIANGNVEPLIGRHVKPQRLPDAILSLRLPYLSSTDWGTIFELREKENDSLENLREKILNACLKVSAERGSKSFDNAVADIQERIIDKGVDEVKKAFRSKSFRYWANITGLSLSTITLEILCFMGLPPLGAIAAGSSLVTGAIKMATDFIKEEQEWKRRAKADMPMYFLWRLKHH